MIDAIYRRYADYESFVRDLLFAVIEDHHATVVCNWRDAQGILESLNGKVLCGRSIALDIESGMCFDDDVLTAQMNDGNMLITIFDNGSMVCEAALFTDKAISFIDGRYYIERDASSALQYAITSPIIPFQVEKKFRF